MLTKYTNVLFSHTNFIPSTQLKYVSFYRESTLWMGYFFGSYLRKSSEITRCTSAMFRDIEKIGLNSDFFRKFV